jgi:hypothetical protein
VKRRAFISLLGGAAVAWPLAARAQQAGKIPRVGFMGNSTAALEANLVEPFREGLAGRHGPYPGAAQHGAQSAMRCASSSSPP